MKTKKSLCRRSGNIVVLTAVMMIVMMAMLAFAVDVGYLMLVRTQMQSSADSSSMGATWDLVGNLNPTPSSTPTTIMTQALATARHMTQLNYVSGGDLAVADSDVIFGRLNVAAGDGQMTFTNPARYNATRVRLRRQDALNGEIPLFFARVLGIATSQCYAEATAAFIDNFKGFKTPGDGGNLNILPFAVDKQTWDAMLSGIADDEWKWDSTDKQVKKGSDGVLEVNLYPQSTGSPGNRGTIDIGKSNNSTSDLSRQIREGISPDDLSYHDGKLELGSDGTLPLNGDTGISAGVKDELSSIVGQTRIIPIFSAVGANGNKATYTIVGFAGVRIMAVDLTGSKSSKYLIVQPAIVEVHGGTPGDDDTHYTYFLRSPVYLVN